MPDSSPAPTSSFRQNATNEPAGAHVGVKSTYAKAAAGTPANATRAANNNAAKPRILIRRKLQPAHSHSVSLDKSTVAYASAKVETSRSAKSLLEPRVVAYGGEVVVSARALAEPREQLDGPSEVGERLVAGVARERCEARVVVMQARVVRHVLEATADRFERVGVPPFAVGHHGLSVKRPRLAPVDPLVRLAGCAADSENGSVPGRLPPRLRPDEHECSWRRVDGLAVDLEGRVPVEHDVQLLLARPGLVVLIDQRAVLAGRVGVDSECVDPEVLAHRDISAAPLDVVEERDLPLRLVVHPITSI